MSLSSPCVVGAGLAPDLGGADNPSLNPQVGANRQSLWSPRSDQCHRVALVLSFANKVFNGKEDVLVFYMIRSLLLFVNMVDCRTCRTCRTCLVCIACIVGCQHAFSSH